jgi:hypothetical protein
MHDAGVPQPAATGEDEQNNPRGLVVQLVKEYKWTSHPAPNSDPSRVNDQNTITLESPYGAVNVSYMTADEFVAGVKAGNFPEGAIVYSTKHPSLNEEYPDSSGFDAAVLKREGQENWYLQNHIKINGLRMYGAQTTYIVVISPKIRDNSNELS